MNPSVHAGEGDERIRTAVCGLGAVLAYVDRAAHALRIPHRFWWRLCDARDLSLGVPDTPENFPRRHGYRRLAHIATSAGYGDPPCHHCGRRVSDWDKPCLLVPRGGAS